MTPTCRFYVAAVHPLRRVNRLAIIPFTEANMSAVSPAVKSWSEVKSFFVLRGWVTLSVTDHQITCCSSSESTIAVYSQRGQLLETYGTCGSGGIGQLHWPFITDSDGSVLIADCRKNRLQVMSEQGEFLTVQLQPPVSQPRCAVLFNSCLYVTSWNTNNIYQYT